MSEPSARISRDPRKPSGCTPNAWMPMRPSAAARRRLPPPCGTSATYRSTPSMSSRDPITTSCTRRIPDYRREHLDQAQALERSVFEYWTHALAYLPVEDFKYYVRDMRIGPRAHGRWFASVTTGDLRRVLAPHSPWRRRSRSATSTMTCSSRRTTRGRAASLPSALCSWRSSEGS